MLRKKLIISISYGYRLRLNVYLRSISQIITEEDYNKKLLKNKSNIVDKYLFFIILSISTKTFLSSCLMSPQHFDHCDEEHRCR